MPHLLFRALDPSSLSAQLMKTQRLQCLVILRIDYCNERSDYYNSDISGPKGEINIINMSVKSPDLSLFKAVPPT